jgi:hypothetical protein
VAVCLGPREAGVGDQRLDVGHLGEAREADRGELDVRSNEDPPSRRRARRLTALDADDYRPSVPFVSLQSASLAVGRLLAGELSVVTLPNLVQHDGLFGPQTATLEQMRATTGCYCQTHARTIEQVRALRRR